MHFQAKPCSLYIVPNIYSETTVLTLTNILN